MKKIYVITVGLLIVVFAFFTCKPDPVDYPPATPPAPPQPQAVNRPPVAYAGKDTAIAIPSCNAAATLTLSSSGSSDPDFSPLTYLWLVYQAPNNSHFQLQGNRQSQAVISFSTPGKYGIELTVTDPGGLSAKDTIIVDVAGSTAKEYNFDLSITGSFKFTDNYEDCYYCYNPCCYNDVCNIDGTGTFTGIGLMNFYSWESSDSVNASNTHETYFGLNVSNGTAQVYGTSSVNLKRIFLDGGGAFTGTFTPNGGSAMNCDPTIFNGLAPLTVTGTLNATTKAITLNIKGKIYF